MPAQRHCSQFSSRSRAVCSSSSGAAAACSDGKDPLGAPDSVVALLSVGVHHLASATNDVLHMAHSLNRLSARSLCQWDTPHSQPMGRQPALDNTQERPCKTVAWPAGRAGHCEGA